MSCAGQAAALVRARRAEMACTRRGARPRDEGRAVALSDHWAIDNMNGGRFPMTGGGLRLLTACCEPAPMFSARTMHLHSFISECFSPGQDHVTLTSRSSGSSLQEKASTDLRGRLSTEYYCKR
ncbi:unnamed protein product [Prorocentrum cordatum]|uniref:Uncharacterized protein n=1 Tax=Prorocentrum cordatum TaxID=2364126 RepID=A0ABN9QL00_9DINO|nr:unnamed protein product [Polarella glacialis]